MTFTGEDGRTARLRLGFCPTFLDSRLRGNDIKRGGATAEGKEISIDNREDRYNFNELSGQSPQRGLQRHESAQS